MYFGLRITPEKFNCPFGLALKIIKHLLAHPKVEKDMYICADETINHLGEKTHHHFHFNFQADFKHDSLSKNIKRWFLDHDYKITGNDSFSLTAFNEPEDVDRWYRYCMKEKYLPQYTKLGDYSPEQIKQMEVCSKDERTRSIKYNIEKEKKKNEKKSMFQRVEIHLNKLEKDLKTFKAVYMEILQYYIENEIPSLNSRTIDGHTNLYLLKNKIITADEFYDINH